MNRRTFGVALSVILGAPLLTTSACKLKPNSTGAPELQRDAAPLFVLEDEQEQKVALGELLIRGPVVVYFYRGFW